METLTRTAVVHGGRSILVEVECSTTSGFAGLQLVGNTGDQCRDGKERAKAALERLGYRLGHKRILINLSPADCKKKGNHFDLPLAVSIATLLSEKPPNEAPKDWLFAAELALNGELRPVRAVIPLALSALEHGLKGIVLCHQNKSEMTALRLLPQMHAAPLQFQFFSNLKEVLEWLFTGQTLEAKIDAEPSSASIERNFDDMHMCPSVKHMVLSVVHGNHSVLLRGSPGCGKSMLSQRLMCLKPKLGASHHLDVLQLYSIKWDRVARSIIEGRPPMRSPHHSSSPQALLGTAEEPGELALAHGGMLFLDELPEFRRDLLEALREPLETGYVHISRAQRKAEWKADVQLIAACNNCPCGYFGSKRFVCRCASKDLLHYRGKLSGPLLDRIDLHFNMPEPTASDVFTKAPPAGQTKELKQILNKARDFVLGLAGGSESFNAALSIEQIFERSMTDATARTQLIRYVERLQLSSRSLVKLFRLARTLADLDLSVALKAEHLERASHWQHRISAERRGESIAGMP